MRSGSPSPRRFLRPIATIALALSVTACPGVRIGTGTLNEQPPSSSIATPIKTGTFFPESGADVSGNVVLYRLNSGGFILRLSGLVAPSETGLQVVLFADGAAVYRAGLRSTTGNQNYTVSIAEPFNWNWVAIYSTSTVMDYAKATLN